MSAMKNMLKKITAAVLIAAALLSLSSCASTLDEMRDMHALINEDGTKITLNGEEYILLDAEYLPIYYEGWDNVIYVTDEDVPLLLSSFIGSGANQLNDIFILSLTPDYYTAYYCRSDKYAEISDIIDNEEYFDTYMYRGENRNGKYIEYTFTPEQASTFEEMLKRSRKAEKLDGDVLGFTIYAEGHGGLFGGYLDIYVKSGSYYIVNGLGTVYKISEADSEILEGIIEACKTAN